MDQPVSTRAKVALVVGVLLALWATIYVILYVVVVAITTIGRLL